jgi:lipopolysaccharide export system protein LptC
MPNRPSEAAAPNHRSTESEKKDTAISPDKKRGMLPSKKTLKTILVIGIVLIVGLLIAIFLKYREYSEDPSKLVEAIPEGTDISIGEIRHTAVKDGRKEWSLEAASANYSDNAQRAVFDDVQVTLFMENGREINVKGQAGQLDTQTNDIAISGNVVVQDADYRLEAESILYDHAQRTISIPVPVTISGKTFKLAGRKMDVDLTSETAHLSGAVEGIFSGANTPRF